MLFAARPCHSARYSLLSFLLRNVKLFSELFSSLLFGHDLQDARLFLEAMDALKVILVLGPTHGLRTVGRLLLLKSVGTTQIMRDGEGKTSQ